MNYIPDDFVPWLDGYLRSQNLNDNQLAKKAGISQSVISRIRSGHQKRVGPKVAIALARALGVPISIMFAKAGIANLDGSSSADGSQEISALYSSLSKQDQDELMEIARMKAARGKSKYGS